MGQVRDRPKCRDCPKTCRVVGNISAGALKFLQRIIRISWYVRHIREIEATHRNTCFKCPSRMLERERDAQKRKGVRGEQPAVQKTHAFPSSWKQHSCIHGPSRQRSGKLGTQLHEKVELVSRLPHKGDLKDAHGNQGSSWRGLQAARGNSASTGEVWISHRKAHVVGKDAQGSCKLEERTQGRCRRRECWGSIWKQDWEPRGGMGRRDGGRQVAGGTRATRRGGPPRCRGSPLHAKRTPSLLAWYVHVP